MEDAASPMRLKLKKVFRYTRLYGIRRTYIKVQGRRHMSRRFQSLPPSSHRLLSSQVVGLIGCGNYAFSNIAYYLARQYGRVIGACMDIDPHRAASLAQYFGAPLFTSDAAELLDQDRIRLVYIASNHASHAEYAVQALEKGKDVYIEKPHVVNQDQLDRLVEAEHRYGGRVYLGFNRPVSHFGQQIRDILSCEPAPGMYNWFVVGHALKNDHWYHRPAEGGRVLGNLCHWTDFLYHLVDDDPFPIQITPTRGDRADVDICVTFSFADGSTGVICFSEKDEPFEGIREKFCAHKGKCLLTMDDFQSMTVDVHHQKRKYRRSHRDQGHRNNILGAYASSIHRLPYDRQCEIKRMVDTATIFLGTKTALERNETTVIYPFQPRQSLAVA